MTVAEHYLVHYEYTVHKKVDAKILATSAENAHDKALELIKAAGGRPLEVTVTKEDDGSN